jgi:putative SOS response-associated peptidase YedK
MAFAGLWEGFRWTDGTVTRSFCIIMTDANAEMTELHAEGRAPVSHVTIGKIIAERAVP